MSALCHVLWTVVLKLAGWPVIKVWAIGLPTPPSWEHGEGAAQVIKLRASSIRVGVGEYRLADILGVAVERRHRFAELARTVSDSKTQGHDVTATNIEEEEAGAIQCWPSLTLSNDP